VGCLYEAQSNSPVVAEPGGYVAVAVSRAANKSNVSVVVDNGSGVEVCAEATCFGEVGVAGSGSDVGVEASVAGTGDGGVAIGADAVSVARTARAILSASDVGLEQLANTDRAAKRMTGIASRATMHLDVRGMWFARERLQTLVS
jgi:hypothetical protein